MKKTVILILAAVSSGLFADSVEDRLNELEKKVAVLEQAMKPTIESMEARQRLTALREKARNRMGEDSKVYSPEDMKIIETLYVAAAQNLKTPSAIENLKILISKYPKSNRSGCAALYLGQVTNDDEQIKYLKQAIDDFGDCFYGNGVQVGAYARFVLSRVYILKGEQEKASQLINELRADYPDAVNHKGISLISIIERNPLADK